MHPCMHLHGHIMRAKSAWLPLNKLTDVLAAMYNRILESATVHERKDSRLVHMHLHFCSQFIY